MNLKKVRNEMALKYWSHFDKGTRQKVVLNIHEFAKKDEAYFYTKSSTIQRAIMPLIYAMKSKSYNVQPITDNILWKDECYIGRTVLNELPKDNNFTKVADFKDVLWFTHAPLMNTLDLRKFVEAVDSLVLKYKLEPIQWLQILNSGINIFEKISDNPDYLKYGSIYNYHIRAAINELENYIYVDEPKQAGILKRVFFNLMKFYKILDLLNDDKYPPLMNLIKKELENRGGILGDCPKEHVYRRALNKIEAIPEIYEPSFEELREVSENNWDIKPSYIEDYVMRGKYGKVSFNIPEKLLMQLILEYPDVDVQYRLLPIDGENQFRHIITRGDNDYLAFVFNKYPNHLYGIKKLENDKFRIFGMKENENVDYRIESMF